jgi:hypothetical protein
MTDEDLQLKNLEVMALTLLQEVRRLESIFGVLVAVCAERNKDLEKFCNEFDTALKMIGDK